MFTLRFDPGCLGQRDGDDARVKSSPVLEKGELKMKKMYEKTFRGYYVMSVVLGLLLALAVATMLEVAVLDAVDAAATLDEIDLWDNVWGYLPLNLCDWFWRSDMGLRNLNVLAVTASVLTVGIFVRMSGTKGSRTKILQAVATALLALLLALAYGYATRGWIRTASLALVPVLLMVVPLTILRKTQQPVDGGAFDWARDLWVRVRYFAREHRQVAVGMIIALGAIFCVAVSVIIHYLFR